jgi:hypothetical protein
MTAKKTPKKRAVKMLAPVTAVQAVERIYGHMITDLKSAIEAATADNSIRGFVLAQQAKFDADPTDPTAHTFEIRNLYRVFSLDNPQRMSLNLYIKLCQALGIGGARMLANPITPGSNESLVDYLAKDFDIIWKTVLCIQYQGA